MQDMTDSTLPFVAVSEPSIEGNCTLAVTGDADVSGSPALKEAIGRLIKAGGHHVFVDLTRARYIDSTCLGVLVDAHRKLRRRGGAISVLCGAPRVARLFSLTGLDKVFDVQLDRGGQKA